MVHGNYQMNLFEDTVEEAQILNKMDLIRKRFGVKALTTAAALKTPLKK